LPINQVPFELLFQITLCGGATDDAETFTGNRFGNRNGHRYYWRTKSDVADTLMATSRVYTLFQRSRRDTQESNEETQEKGEYQYEDKNRRIGFGIQIKREQKPKKIRTCAICSTPGTTRR
jgi:hypothetical protein